MKSIYKEAGERIYYLRSLKGYTRDTLAEMADISAKFLYEIETGKKGFSAQILYNISSALCVRCDYILTGKNRDEDNYKLINVIQLFDEGKIDKLSELLTIIYELLLIE